jgi:hypothetical protein
MIFSIVGMARTWLVFSLCVLCNSTDLEELSLTPMVSISSSDSATSLSLQKRRRHCRFWKMQYQVAFGRSWVL